MLRFPTEGGRMGRGVYVAPWMGPDGELVLLAITSTQRLATDTPVMIPHGTDRVSASDNLWELLDNVDPDPRAHLRAV